MTISILRVLGDAIGEREELRKRVAVLEIQAARLQEERDSARADVDRLKSPSQETRTAQQVWDAMMDARSVPHFPV